MSDAPAGRPHPVPERLCVYTALIGNYEPLIEQPVATNSRIPFICFTDDPHLRSATWQVRSISCLLDHDPIRSQREIKLQPHKYLPEFDASLYIDNAVLLIEPPEAVFQRYYPASGLALPRHSYRQSVCEEFIEVYKGGFDEHARILEQWNHYALSCPEVLDERPYWGGIQLRNHQNTQVRALLDLWMMHVLRYARRDQLSINFVTRQLGFKPDIIEIDNFVSWFHRWPLASGRVRDKGLRSPMASLMPAVARTRVLEREIQTLNAKIETMKRARVTARIAASAAQIRRLARSLAGCFGRRTP
jgi:hypothetical protein